MATDAVVFLKKSGLGQDVLAQIWDMADKGAKGYLDYTDFCVAIKLIALAQSSLGLEMKVENLGADVLPPNLGDASKLAESSSVGVPGTWEVSPSEQSKYSQVFESLGPTNGLLSGALCRQVFVKSNLPVDILGKIWELSDIDRDGSLDREEFILAMHLVYKVSVEKQQLPAVLSASLIPPSKEALGSSTASAPVPTSTATPATVPSSLATWVVTPAEKIQYDALFQNADVNKNGYLTGADAREILMKSGLPPQILAHIWQLCDSNGSGKLNNEQFALAMHLTNARLRGMDVPVQLTPEMIPPSMRQPATGNVSMTATVPMTVPSEFPETEELKALSGELEKVREDRKALENEIAEEQQEVNKRNAELDQVQRDVDHLTQLLQQLEQQKVEAQKRLDDLDEQV